MICRARCLLMLWMFTPCHTPSAVPDQVKSPRRAADQFRLPGSTRASQPHRAAFSPMARFATSQGEIFSRYIDTMRCSIAAAVTAKPRPTAYHRLLHPIVLAQMRTQSSRAPNASRWSRHDRTWLRATKENARGDHHRSREGRTLPGDNILYCMQCGLTTLRKRRELLNVLRALVRLECCLR